MIKHTEKVSFSLGALAYAISLAGTLLLKIESVRIAAFILLLAPGVMAVFALGRRKWPLAVFARPSRNGKTKVRRRIAMGMTVGAVVLIVGANLYHLTHAAEVFGIGGSLWLLSILTLAAAAFVWPSRNIEAVSWQGWEVITFASIIGLALILRVWDLRDFPNNVFPDEILAGTVATQSFLSADPVSVFSTVWHGVELPALWFKFQALLMQSFGTLLSVIRLPAAIFGAAAVVPLYFLVRSQWGRTAAITAGAVMAFSASNIHYSRLALPSIVPQFFWPACFLFLLRGLRSRHPLDFAIAGLFAGLSENFYFGTRLLPILLIVFLAFLVAKDAIPFFERHDQHDGDTFRGNVRRHATAIGFTVLGYLVGFGPLLTYFFAHPNLYFGRGIELMIWDHIPTGWADLVLMLQTFWPVVTENLLGFSTHPCQDIVYYGTLLLVPEAALLVLGFALLLWKWRDPAAFLLLLSGLGVLFVGGTLVLYPNGFPPMFDHWTPAFPMFYCALAIPVGLWFDTTWTSRNVLPAWLKPALLASGLAFSCLLNMTYYFGTYHADAEVLRSPDYRAAQQTYDRQIALSRYVASLGASYNVIAVGRMPVPYDANLTRYLLGADARFTNVPDPGAVARSKATLAFIFFPEDEQYITQVRSIYPDGASGRVNGPTGQPVFLTYVPNN